MSKIILERHEWNEITDILEKHKGINYCEIEVESINGLGKTTKLTIPHSIEGVTGEFIVTITDENDW